MPSKRPNDNETDENARSAKRPRGQPLPTLVAEPYSPPDADLKQSTPDSNHLVALNDALESAASDASAAAAVAVERKPRPSVVVSPTDFERCVSQIKPSSRELTGVGTGKGFFTYPTITLAMKGANVESFGMFSSPDPENPGPSPKEPAQWEKTYNLRVPIPNSAEAKQLLDAIDAKVLASLGPKNAGAIDTAFGIRKPYRDNEPSTFVRAAVYPTCRPRADGKASGGFPPPQIGATLDVWRSLGAAHNFSPADIDKADRTQSGILFIKPLHTFPDVQGVLQPYSPYYALGKIAAMDKSGLTVSHVVLESSGAWTYRKSKAGVTWRLVQIVFARASSGSISSAMRVDMQSEGENMYPDLGFL